MTRFLSNCFLNEKALHFQGRVIQIGCLIIQIWFIQIQFNKYYLYISLLMLKKFMTS